MRRDMITRKLLLVPVLYHHEPSAALATIGAEADVHTH